MSLGGGGLKYPPYGVFVKGYPHPTENFALENFWKKMTFLKKNFGTSRDFNKYKVDFSKFF
jgi:hypothetical protein